MHGSELGTPRGWQVFANLNIVEVNRRHRAARLSPNRHAPNSVLKRYLRALTKQSVHLGMCRECVHNLSTSCEVLDLGLNTKC